MNTNNYKTAALTEVINAIQGYFSFVLGQKKLFGLLMLSTVLLAIIYGFFQSPKYEATSSFVLEEKSSAGGGLAGLASQFGFDMNSLSGAGSGLFSGDNILDIVKSRVIVEKVLLTKIDSTVQGPTLADLYLDFTGLGKKLVKKGKAVDFYKIKNGQTTSLLQDSVLFAIYEKVTNDNITVDRVNKKGSIFKITTITDNAIFSKTMTDKLLFETSKFYINIKTNSATDNVQKLQRRADSLSSILNTKSYNAAAFQILDPNIAYKSISVPGELSQRDKTIVYSIYAEVVKNLEIARMSLVNQTPNIQILDQPKYPLIDQRKSLLFLMVVGAMIGLVIGLMASVYIYTDK
jgi:capsule polysaccharide export protein KpsE/RkpR